MTKLLLILGLLLCVFTRANEPVLDPPTLHSLGVYWLVPTDDSQSHVDLAYRKPGGASWIPAAPLFRVEPRAKPYKDQGGKPKTNQMDVPPGSTLFAGSLLLLDPDTAYELKLTLGQTEKLLHARTIAEPTASANARIRHVIPGGGGGAGTATDPFKGLDAAQAAAQPGDVLLLHAGTYNGPLAVKRSGEPAKPIIWRGAGDGEVVLDGKAPLEKLAGVTVELPAGTHDVWFENLTFQNGFNLLRARGEVARIVVRRCILRRAICGVVALGNAKSGSPSAFFIADNLFEGFMPWPATHEQWETLPESRAVWIGGSGHVVCYNRIHHWKDGLDTADGPICASIDFHNNDVSEMFDDGSEMDGSERNCRNFLNRYTNTLTGVSLQPVYGGPVYVFRNVIYNPQTEAFKLHNSPSGGLLFHNTVLKNGSPLVLNTSAEVIHCISRNNLLVGTGDRAMSYEAKMTHCDFDYDGFGGFSGPVFIKWNGQRYATPDEARAKSPVEKHCTIVDPAATFASGLKPPADPKTVYDHATIDARLKPDSAAIDAGEILPGLNDGFSGKAPDLGAFELGAELPHYGPREQK